MQSLFQFIKQNWNKLLLPSAVTLITSLVGLAIRNILFRRMRRWAVGTKTKIDDIVVEAVRNPFLIWVLMFALHLGVQVSHLPNRARNTVAEILLVLFIVSMTLVFSRLTGIFLRFHIGPGSVSSLTENLIRIVVLMLGGMVVLNTFGISIVPMLTALGVGGIAVALALQDTLSNLFGGFYVSVAGQVRIGDYIRLDSGEEGYIVDIRWRSTSLRSLQNNVIIVPNAKLAKAAITNYDLMEQTMSVSIAVSVSYDCDPEIVESVLLEVVRVATGPVPGLLAAPQPVVRFIPGFGPYSLDLTLTCSVQKFADQYLVQHELRKRIFKRFREARIEMPFPTRTIYMHSIAPPTQSVPEAPADGDGPPSAAHED